MLEYCSGKALLALCGCKDVLKGLGLEQDLKLIFVCTYLYLQYTINNNKRVCIHVNLTVTVGGIVSRGMLFKLLRVSFHRNTGP